MSEYTFQVNLSPGDVAYAALTVPRLRAAHPGATEAVAVVDCCRPQRTRIIDPDTRFPAEAFRERVIEICRVADALHHDGHLDRVVLIRPGDPALREWSRKYLRGIVRETHDYGGCALSSYLGALEVPKTRYVVHYDADMLIHHDAPYDWATHGISAAEDDPRVVAVTPRISPPASGCDAPSCHEERPLTPHRDGWLNDWFSTRCFMMDLHRLQSFLPWLHGRTLVDTVAVKYLRRGYPRSPEMTMFRRIGGAGGRRLNLGSERAWLLHPTTKPKAYLELLPQIIEHVASGKIPDSQYGHTEIDIAAWSAYLGGARER